MTQDSLLQTLKENPFVLAPMAGITDHAFRTFMRRRQTSLVVTELISATGLEYKSQRTIDLMSFDEEQRPVGIQLFGGDPEHMAQAAKMVEAHGADFVDINFGCPVPKVVKKGAGSAMLKDLPAMKELLRSVVSAVKIPVTIKIRTGWDASSRNAVDVCNLAYDEGITWVGIHGRTRAQGYSGLADWDFIADVKSQVKIPILGNGDIHTPVQAVHRLLTSNCDGVLIGRGALKNPFIFMESLALYKQFLTEEPQEDLKKSLIDTWTKYKLYSSTQKPYDLLIQDLYECYKTRASEHIVGLQLKKFSSWFSAGYSGAANFRKSLFQLKNNDEVLSLALDFFGSINQTQEDTSHEDFLMGGHG